MLARLPGGSYSLSLHRRRVQLAASFLPSMCPLGGISQEQYSSVERIHNQKGASNVAIEHGNMAHSVRYD